jgi:hypothetical protein
VVAVLGLVLLFLCGSLGLLGTWASLGLPGISPRETQTALSMPTAAPTLAPEIVLFQDDFSDPASGWPTIQNARGGYEYRTDGYHIFVHELDAVLWAKTTREDQDASISVEAKPITEGTDSYYGLTCRIQDDQNFYYFVVRASGEFTIGKYKNAAFQSLLPEGWRSSAAIQKGAQTNRLKADCVGNSLRFYANNVMLAEAADTDFSSGASGMLVGALDPQGFEALFNHFVITQPTQ